MGDNSNLSILGGILLLTNILLSACQSMDITSNISKSNVTPDTNTDTKLEKRAIAPFNAITGKITNLYAKGSLKDYIGDLDKKNLEIAIQNAADTDQPQIFTNQDSGINGKAEVIQSRTLSTQEPGKKDGIRECKTIRQTIVLMDKREVIESVVLCKGLDGWI